MNKQQKLKDRTDQILTTSVVGKRFIFINDRWLSVGDKFKNGLFNWEITFIGIDGCCLAKNILFRKKTFTGNVIVC